MDMTRPFCESVPSVTPGKIKGRDAPGAAAFLQLIRQRRMASSAVVVVAAG